MVLGVFVALEVDRFNDRQNERAEELELLGVLQDELHQDIANVNADIAAYSQVEAFGNTTMRTLDSKGCMADCWVLTVAAFHASQWLDVSISRNTYQEMTRRGFPSNVSLKVVLNEHFELAEQRSVLTRELPRYRELVRSIIPPEVQRHLWSNCFKASGRNQFFYDDCEAPSSDADFQSIVETLQATPGLKASLTFWLSNVQNTVISFPSQITAAKTAIAALEEEMRR